jgi:hypothetical protein
MLLARLPLFVFFVLVACTQNPQESEPFSWQQYSQDVSARFEEFNKLEGGVAIFEPVKRYYGLTDDRVRELRHSAIERATAKLRNLDPAAKSIPLITHRIWVTSMQTPHEVPTSALERYMESVRFLKDKGNYTHYFWCLSKKNIPQTIRTLKESDVGNLIQVREFSEIWPQLRSKHHLKYLMENNYYTSVSDFLRVNVVYLYGGIYTDMPWLFKQDITPLLNNFDYLVHIAKFSEGNLMLDKNLMAAQKGDALLNHWLELMDKFHTIPQEIQELTPGLRRQLEWMMAAYTSLLPAIIEKNSLLLPLMMPVVEDRHFSSWNKDNKPFGNKNLDKANTFNLFTLKP